MCEGFTAPPQLRPAWRRWLRSRLRSSVATLRGCYLALRAYSRPCFAPPVGAGFARRYVWGAALWCPRRPLSLRSLRSVASSLDSLPRSFVRRAPSGGTTALCLCPSFYGIGAALSPSGVSSVASLPRSRSLAPRPPFRRGRARFLCDPRSDQRRIPPAALDSPNPRLPPGEGAPRSTRPCLVAASCFESPALLLDERPLPCPPSVHKIRILYNCQSVEKERSARFSFSPAWSITSFEKKV